MNSPPATAFAQIRARAEARRTRKHEQRELWTEDDDFHETIRGKLDGMWQDTQFYNFSRCGQEDYFRTCRNCGEVKKLQYACSLKWCPRCQWKITLKRSEVLQWWAERIKQPKHLVLTQRNFEVLTRRKIKIFVKNLAALRRRKIFSAVKGGTCSIEITNEGKGWHLHAHLLLDVRWLDAGEVARIWGQQVGQEFAIVKIKDVRGQDYVKEVAKYVVEGSELAKWPAEKINEFVRAVKGSRFFGAFGSLRVLAPAIRAYLLTLKPTAAVCDCGCADFVFEDEAHAIMHEAKRL